LVYAAGEPQGQLKQFVDWILSPDGQRVVLDLGYVPENEHK
jgi:ABC-type phosphate transport system substrate-binding protein